MRIAWQGLGEAIFCTVAVTFCVLQRAIDTAIILLLLCSARWSPHGPVAHIGEVCWKYFVGDTNGAQMRAAYAHVAASSSRLAVSPVRPLSCTLCHGRVINGSEYVMSWGNLAPSARRWPGHPVSELFFSYANQGGIAREGRQFRK
jgi:hypothetical protein